MEVVWKKKKKKISTPYMRYTNIHTISAKLSKTGAAGWLDFGVWCIWDARGILFSSAYNNNKEIVGLKM